jgi:hypothetical protein
MSAVRMCDRCGTLFSERAEGWGTFTGTTTRRNERTGRPETVTETLDLGPECNAAANNPVTVKALTPSTAADRLADINAGKVPDGLTVEG